MSKKGVFTLLTVISVCIAFVFTACEQSTDSGIEETFAEIKSVTPIQGGQNTTMNLQSGSDDEISTFTITLSDGIAREGWCVEWDEPSIKGTQNGVSLYSTKGHEEWRELNYFMSIKDDLRSEDPDLSFRDIQVIIWSLVNNPEFDVDKISEYKNIDPDIYYDGQALFDVQKVKEIVSLVKNRFEPVAMAKSINGSFNTILESYEEPGVTIIENDGQTILLGNETAYAVKTITVNDKTVVDSNLSTCFDEEILEDISFPQWGWTNGPISDPSGELTFEIYAGAGQCDLNKGTLVGQLTINYNDGTLTATYTMTETSFTGDTYTMTETHFYVGTEPYPKGPNNKFTVAPGQYGSHQNHNNITEYTYEIDGLSGDIYFIAHAVVSGFDPDAD